jgi:hypothetical protein
MLLLQCRAVILCRDALLACNAFPRGMLLYIRACFSSLSSLQKSSAVQPGANSPFCLGLTLTLLCCCHSNLCRIILHAGGMLLYIGMFQLIAEEFSREDMIVRTKLRLGMYAALCLGAASMCVLGIWA